MHAIFMTISRAMAYLGGTVLTAIVLLTCLSILGRQLNTVFHLDWIETTLPALSAWMLDTVKINEIRGSYEITESALAFVIFAFLPLTQITSGHAIVDVFTSRMGGRANRALRMIAEVFFALALLVIAVQLYDGTLSKLRSGQTTLFLQYPVWWSYALSLSAAIVAAIVAVYVAVMRVLETMAGRDLLPDTAGAEH